MDYAKNQDYQNILTTVRDNLEGIAWPTVITFIVAAFVLILSQIAYANQIIGLLTHLILYSYFFYIMYTPLHEAVHQNISGKNKRFKFLNPFLGCISAAFYLHSYTQHRWSHLEHHKYANNPKLDPDIIIKGPTWFLIAARGFFILLIKDFFYIRKEGVKDCDAGKRAMRLGTIESLIPIIILVVLTNLFELPWYHFFISYVFPLLFAVMLLGIFFDYLVHMPHESSEKFGDTNIIRTKKWFDGPMTWIWLYQNYHGMHHLFPKLPFYKYKYKKVFLEREQELIKLGLPVYIIEEKN